MPDGTFRFTEGETVRRLHVPGPTPERTDIQGES